MEQEPEYQNANSDYMNQNMLNHYNERDRQIKKFACLFAEWIEANGFDLSVKPYLWMSSDRIVIGKTTEELFELFINETK